MGRVCGKEPKDAKPLGNSGRHAIMAQSVTSSKSMRILGIETSCDETAAAVVEQSPAGFNVRASVVASQIAIHAQYGGVVPEVAARNHVLKILPVIQEALARAQATPADIDRIAVTAGPGLITALNVGLQTARTLAFAWRKPLVPVNHLRAHVYAAWLPASGGTRSSERGARDRASSTQLRAPTFPLVALIVSGGHTELVVMRNQKTFRLLGATLDDAAGEAFDKVAKILGLPYPGGPAIAQLAETGNPTALHFPRPMLDSHDLNFSYSGLKTHLLYHVRKHPPQGNELADIAASFQAAVVDSLVPKVLAAAKRVRAVTVVLAGGVAANRHLRTTLGDAVTELGLDFLVPDFQFCTDNAAMIATAGFFAKHRPWDKIGVDPNWPVDHA